MIFRLLFVITLSSTLLQYSKCSEGAIELTDETFDAKLESLDTSLVMFYAPWCGHCKKLKPEFDKAAKDLLNHDPPAHLAKVDCDGVGKEICKKYSVSGYPTLKIFNNGVKSEDYSGPRDAPGIVKLMKSKVGPASKSFTDVDSLMKYADSLKDPLVILFDNTSDDLKKTFMNVARILRESCMFADVSASKEDMKKFASGKEIALFRPLIYKSGLEDRVVPYTGEMDQSSLKDWIKNTKFGFVGHRTSDNANEFNTPLLVAYYDVDYVKNIPGTNYYRNRVMKVAKKEKNIALTYAISNAADFMNELTDKFNIQHVPAASKPKITIIGKDGKKFVMEEEFSVDNLSKFVNDYENGNLTPYIKSEEVSEEDNASNNVKIAVGKNFDELVEKSKKDVLIEFYAPWCGHCKSLAPIYEELGQKMSAEPNVEIVKIDATANDYPSQYSVRGFPTIFWLSAKDKANPKSYNGGRTVDDFIKYIAENAVEELVGYDRKGNEKKTEL